MISKLKERAQALKARLDNMIRMKQELAGKMKQLDNQIIETSGALREMNTFVAELEMQEASKPSSRAKKAGPKKPSKA